MSPAPPSAPPAGDPPVLLQKRYGDSPLQVSTDANGNPNAAPFGTPRFRDVVVDCVMGLDSGDPDDAYGIFLRQSTSNRYACFTVTPNGVANLALADEGSDTLLRLGTGPIPADNDFNRGLGARNRLTIVAFGPALVPSINGFVLTGAVVDGRYKEGAVGAYVMPHGPGQPATLSVEWAQVRAVMADQASIPR